ncbi:MAG: nucleotide exchange factor GrpE [Trueperaceae bacterium]
MRRDEDRPEEGAHAAEQYANVESSEPEFEFADQAGAAAPAGDEAEILREELGRAVEQLSRLEADLREAEDRYLRARAEQDTIRRRLQGEAELARAEGVASALAPSLNVFDDLERALDAAERAADAGSIVPGVRAVQSALLRNLAALDVKLVGVPGDRFDPNLHEALTVVQLRPGAEPGTIDQVFEAGFVQGDQLVRVARVTVFADEGS